jgi:hypothetical protein
MALWTKKRRNRQELNLNRDATPNFAKEPVFRANIAGNAVKLNGFYRGRVEYSRDPLKIGRVKIRVPDLHGDPGALGSSEADC